MPVRARKEDGRKHSAQNNTMTKKRLIVCLMTVLLTLGLFACAQAAETDNLKLAMELSSYEFAVPGEVTVTIEVTNTGESEMPSPITLYYPDGQQVEEFGAPTLAAGSSKRWSGVWNVTQDELNNGKVIFKIRYSVINDSGEMMNKELNFSRSIAYAGAVTAVEVNRIITPTTAGEGQKVTVTYDVVNTGNVDITDISIKENSSISTRRGTIQSVPAGEKGSYSFTTTMKKKDLTSEATITYKAGGKTNTVKKDKATIKYGEINLSAALASDKKGGAPGETVTLTLTLKNTGKVDFQNVTVSDTTLGEVFSGLSVPAGQTVTQQREVTMEGAADYQFTVAGTDTEGNAVETATDRVSLTAIDPSQRVTLEVSASADRDTIYQLPGIVKFVVRVTNTGAAEAKDVTVSASGVTLATFPSILAGETRELTRDVSVSMAGQYRFDAAVKNQLDETEVFNSNIIPIAYAQPTAVPTEAPIITPPLPQYEEIPTADGLPEYVGSIQQVLRVLYWVFMVLAIISLALLAVGVARRIQANVASSKAQDHLERSGSRNYTQPGQHKQSKPEPSTVTTDDEAAPTEADASDAPDEPVQDQSSIEETLRQLYPNTAARMKLDPTVTVDGEDEPGDATEGMELPLEETEETAPQAEEETGADDAAVPEENIAADTAEEAPVRHRRSQRRGQQ